MNFNHSTAVTHQLPASAVGKAATDLVTSKHYAVVPAQMLLQPAMPVVLLIHAANTTAAKPVKTDDSHRALDAHVLFTGGDSGTYEA